MRRNSSVLQLFGKGFGESSSSDAGGPESEDYLDHLSVDSDHSETENIEPQPRQLLQKLIFSIVPIISRWPRPKGCARGAKTSKECWQLFFVEDMIADIVKWTNLMIGRCREMYKDKHTCNDTNPVEMKALIGISYLSGVFRSIIVI
ncbi:hypothetical protein JTB14_011489 [Gonioctena quinquepunctata]|nr:hypothetical protein JTB14_011489 [Gonioctena quinquepunctata]